MTFSDTVKKHGLLLERSQTTTLQVNVGLTCDLTCRHCHQQAGPHRPEQMSAAVIDEVIACARRLRFETADITGGAPELFPGLSRLVTALAQSTPKVIVRTNLTALARPEARSLPELYRSCGVTVAASLPALNPEQTEAQRGSGVWSASLDMLRRLNDLGYGREGSGLELILISNPAGAFLSPAQAQAEQRFHRDLERRHGITFSKLFTLANAPLGRFRSWLESSGNLTPYLEKLEAGFNPCAVEGLMCRSFISVDWNGHLYDCDFNLAAGIPLGGTRRHITELRELPQPGSPIATADYCFTCTAGSGSSCSGSTVP
ncbi:arsenosugar biosynthesis radical SAM (seleno)protein ArsS [Geobacter sp. SVR]|uniref:arsenosugar biosynthesis radical SAM (seleno)protein ArsS n=1 Tax=Geobacter sp. SVR TaxID=2495594 RepID=UPI00143EF571|nr:arsenosugar biosynthesis radical SAM (seleno)protein ArsS [Geobacter sp. SVR]BCS53236.1 radical SAM/Cys-rich domain protein [Geobacter sp. SVR]GCF84621.1 radical SAM/Cys-rich domain protein [Geobacter sp. SVR]